MGKNDEHLSSMNEHFLFIQGHNYFRVSIPTVANYLKNINLSKKNIKIIGRIPK